MENYNLKYKEEIKIIKKCNKNYFGEREKKYLLFILNLILILLLFLRYILFIFSKINKSYREEALKSGRNYLNKCLEGKIKNITFKNSLRPKISILVPVYNSQRTIKSAIRSIQNQNMTDIEII